MRRFALAAVLLCSATTVGAKDKDKDKDTLEPIPPIYQAVLDCKSVTDAAERLTCYDRTVESMAMASTKRDLVVMERSTIKQAEKGLFGLSLPSIKIFGGNDDDAVTEIESTISSVRRDINDALIITLADGARWRQIDSQPQMAKVGDKIKIRKAALGSFFANINGRSGFKMSRMAN
jgi:hypothetical protein